VDMCLESNSPSQARPGPAVAVLCLALCVMLCRVLSSLVLSCLVLFPSGRSGRGQVAVIWLRWVGGLGSEGGIWNRQMNARGWIGSIVLFGQTPRKTQGAAVRVTPSLNLGGVGIWSWRDASSDRCGCGSAPSYPLTPDSGAKFDSLGLSFRLIGLKIHKLKPPHSCLANVTAPLL